MTRWNPQNKVGRQERIGRRSFDEPMLAGAAGQPSFSGIKMTHFEEKRGNDVSVDRLGATGIDQKVVKYLLPRAEAAGKKFAKPKLFDGWATVSAKELIEGHQEKLVVMASPKADEESNGNIYHAHIVTPSHFESYMMALYLRHIFTTYGEIKIGKRSETSLLNRFRGHPIIRWIVSHFS